MVLAKSTKSERRRSLNNLPEGLFDSFSETIDRVRNQGASPAKHSMGVLLWVFAAERPMSVEELQHALAVKEGDETFDTDNILTVNKILGWCLGLIVVDQQTKSVRLVHYTLKEYFDSVQHTLFPNAHMHLEKICITYLLFPEFDIREILSSRYCGQALTLRRRFPLLEYAGLYWVKHAEKHASTDIIHLESRLLAKPSTHCAIQAYIWNSGALGRIFEGGNGIHLSVYFRIKRLIEAATRIENSAHGGLLIHIILNHDQTKTNYWSSSAENLSSSPTGTWMTSAECLSTVIRHPGIDFAAVDLEGQTCLHLAIIQHRHDLAQILLDDARIDQNKLNNDGDSPLHLALKEFIILDFPSKSDRIGTKIYHVTADTRNDLANEKLIERLLEIESTDVMCPDRTGASAIHLLFLRSPTTRRKLLPAFLRHPRFDISRDIGCPDLLTAAIATQDSVATEFILKLSQSLVEKHSKVNPLLKDIIGYPNALYAAICMGNEAMVRLLVDRGANIKQGKNAIYMAAYMGNEAIVRLLLDRRADINAEDGEFGNALEAAVYEDNEVMVRLLLDCGADVNAQGGLYGNALQAAVCEGNEVMVQLLLDRGADVNARGGELLQTAVAEGNEVMVQLLLDRGADINAKDGRYGSALHMAVDMGNEAMVRLLLDSGVDNGA